MLKRISQWLGIALSGVGALSGAGCAVPSLHGIAEGASPVFEEAFLGTWTDTDTTEFVVTQGADQTYSVSMYFEEDDDPPIDLDLAVTLVEISDQRFVDVRLSEEEIGEVAERYGTLLLPVHLFYRVDLEEGDLVLYRLERESLKEPLGEEEFRHLDDAHVITSSPQRIRQALASLLSDSEAWDEAFRLTRRDQ